MSRTATDNVLLDKMVEWWAEYRYMVGLGMTGEYIAVLDIAAARLESRGQGMAPAVVVGTGTGT